MRWLGALYRVINFGFPAKGFSTRTVCILPFLSCLVVYNYSAWTNGSSFSSSSTYFRLFSIGPRALRHKILYRSLLVITLFFSTTHQNSFSGILNSHESNCQSMSNVGSGSTCCRSNDFFKKSCQNCKRHSQLCGDTIIVFGQDIHWRKVGGWQSLAGLHTTLCKKNMTKENKAHFQIALKVTFLIYYILILRFFPSNIWYLLFH